MESHKLLCVCVCGRTFYGKKIPAYDESFRVYIFEFQMRNIVTDYIFLSRSVCLLYRQFHFVRLVGRSFIFSLLTFYLVDFSTFFFRYLASVCSISLSLLYFSFIFNIFLFIFSRYAFLRCWHDLRTIVRACMYFWWHEFIWDDFPFYCSLKSGTLYGWRRRRRRWRRYKGRYLEHTNTHTHVIFHPCCMKLGRKFMDHSPHSAFQYLFCPSHQICIFNRFHSFSYSTITHLHWTMIIQLINWATLFDAFLNWIKLCCVPWNCTNFGKMAVLR